MERHWKLIWRLTIDWSNGNALLDICGVNVNDQRHWNLSFSYTNLGYLRAYRSIGMACKQSIFMGIQVIFEAKVLASIHV